MLKPPINELIEIAGSRYALVVATSKRARKIVEGEAVLIDTVSNKPVAIATEEIYNGKIEIISSVED